ncbi:hypothetical protein CQW23_35056 [Capsicum baccatum]|uniref:Protein TAR1 n=1 Tax=Capsicum baccatum TaxID=33114 RepID=A0A2G2UX85_CAPBA|nr:hypothetical protein CQW23_35056 [Capsicum baccatum]
MEPFPSSAFKVLILIFATTTKICTDVRSARARAQGYAATATLSYSSEPGTCPDGRVRIPLVRTSFELAVQRTGKAPEGTIRSPSPGRHAATRSRCGSSLSCPPTADGFGTGTPVPSPQSQSFTQTYGSILPTFLAYIVPSTRDERFARQYRCGPPPEFPLASPRSGIVHHLSGPDRYAHTRTLLRRSRSVGGAPLGGIPPISFLAPYWFMNAPDCPCLGMPPTVPWCHGARISNLTKTPPWQDTIRPSAFVIGGISSIALDGHKNL